MLSFTQITPVPSFVTLTNHFSTISNVCFWIHQIKLTSARQNFQMRYGGNVYDGPETNKKNKYEKKLSATHGAEKLSEFE